MSAVWLPHCHLEVWKESLTGQSALLGIGGVASTVVTQLLLMSMAALPLMRYLPKVMHGSLLYSNCTCHKFAATERQSAVQANIAEIVCCALCVW